MIALKKILVATDFGEAADAALAYGRELARTFGATLHVLHVADNMLYVRLGRRRRTSSVAAGAAEGHRRGRADAAGRAALSTRPRDAERGRKVVITSTAPAAAIVQYARDRDIDLIIDRARTAAARSRTC